MTLVIFGDSHTLALVEAWGRMPASDRVSLNVDVLMGLVLLGHELVVPFFDVTDGRLTFSPARARHALEETTGRPYLSADDRDRVFGFSLGFGTTLLLRRRMWKRFAPWSANDTGQRSLLSDRVVEALALDHFKYVLEFFGHVVQLGIPCFSIAAPPVTGNEAAVPDMGASVVIEVDRIARRAVAGRLESLGVPVVWPPEESYAGLPMQSLLREDLATAGDDIHANPAYGRLAWKAIAEQARGIQPWLLLPPLGPRDDV